jgi:hypothetical protein
MGKHFSAFALVPGAGLEPARPQWPQDFKSWVSTNSTIRAGDTIVHEIIKKNLFDRGFFERKTGLEPATPTLARSCSTN